MTCPVILFTHFRVRQTSVVIVLNLCNMTRQLTSTVHLINIMVLYKVILMECRLPKCDQTASNDNNMIYKMYSLN